MFIDTWSGFDMLGCVETVKVDHLYVDQRECLFAHEIVQRKNENQVGGVLSHDKHGP